MMMSFKCILWSPPSDRWIYYTPRFTAGDGVGTHQCLLLYMKKKKNEMAVAGSHRRVTSIRSSADRIAVNSLMRNLSGWREIPLPSSLWKRFQLNQEIKSISLTRLQNCSALAINLSHLFNDDKSA